MFSVRKKKKEKHEYLNENVITLYSFDSGENNSIFREKKIISFEGYDFNYASSFGLEKLDLQI